MSESLNNLPKISVIIPVWNPGPGIMRCIESLRNQTLEDIEMIFVDDCGTDDSMDKVRAAAAEDSRIRILENEENIGAGPSRNRGIEVAQGVYLSFVDPDDYLDLCFYELLYAEARKKEVDIIKGGVKYEKEDGSLLEKETTLNQSIRVGLKSKKPFFFLFISEHQSALYRKDLLLSKNIRYGSSRRGQDTTFLLQVCSHCKSFSTVDETCYIFCERSDSSLHRVNSIQLKGCLDSISEKIDFFLHSQTNNKWAISYLRCWFLSYIAEGSRYQIKPEMIDDLTSYIQSLRSELMRLTFCNNLIHDSFPIYVLYEHTALLPITPYTNPWDNPNLPIQYAKLAGHWVDYFLDNPNNERFCSRDLRIVLIRANMATQGKTKSTYNEEIRREGKRILQSHISRLPARIRLQLPLLTLFAGIALGFPASAKDKIKIVLKIK